MHWLWVLIVGALIGVIAGAITSKGKSMGWISNILAGLIGSSIGQAIFGSWGPQLVCSNQMTKRLNDNTSVL